MHVAVLGAGVVGITSAYYLTEAGHSVTVIDGASDVASGCSFANGSQLSYSYTDAMANPAFLAKLPRILMGRDTGIQFHAPISADLMRWGGAFLKQCTTSKAIANTLATLSMAQRSRDLLTELRNTLNADFSYRSTGKIVLLASKSDVSNAERNCELKAQYKCESSVIDIEKACEIEPAIEKMTGNYSAAVYSPGDDVGDAQAFSQALASYLVANRDCRLCLSTQASGLIVDRKKVRGVATTDGEIEADAIVVSLGAHSPAILKPLGLRPRIIPARGYSITVPRGAHSNSVSVTDLAGRFVISQMGERMRIAGFADFTGFSTARDQKRIQQLVDLTRRRAPFAADYANQIEQHWGGFRPLTPHGRPLVGATPIEGLYLNTGHGSLGWTLACASAESLVNSMASAEESGRNRLHQRQPNNLVAAERETA